MTPKPEDLVTLALPAALTVAGLVVGLVLRRKLFPRLAALTAESRLPAERLLVASLQGPVVLAGAVAGLDVGLELSSLPPHLTRVLERAVEVLLILLVTWVAARLAAAWVNHRTALVKSALPSATLLPNLAQVLVGVVGLLIVLDALGISITPLLTALGVGGLAVALALQDTLANLFAGVHILVSRQVRPGDFVELATGEKGYVQDVTWRYTTIRQLSSNITVVPNAKLASTNTTNYYLPERELSVGVPVGVGYDSDLEAVERVTVEVAREVMREVPGGVPGYEPSIRYNAFGDSSVNFSVNLRGREYVDQYLIVHEFIKRLHRRYAREGIAIPFPTRTVELKR